MHPGSNGLFPQSQPLVGNMSAPSLLSCADMSDFPPTPTASHGTFFWLSNGLSTQNVSSNVDRNDSSHLLIASPQSQLNQNSQQPSALPNISRQNDALSLDTIAVALHELEQLSWNKRSLSVNSADLDQTRTTSLLASTFRPLGTTTTPLRHPSSEKRQHQQFGQRRSCEPPFSPQLSNSNMRPPPVPVTGPLSSGVFVTSSPISSGFHTQSPPGSFTAASMNYQQRRSALSNSVPGSLDSYQIETETVDSGLGNDSSFFLLPASSAPNPRATPGLSSSVQCHQSGTSSHLLRHSTTYQTHSQRPPIQHQSRRPRASSTAAAGPSSRRHLFYCRHHLHARQKPYHFPASCVAALRNDALFNVSTGLPMSTTANSSNALCLRHSCSISSQSRSITPGSSPTRSSEADSLVPISQIMRSRSLDDVHRSVTASSANSLTSRPGHASANQSDLGQWDHGEPEEQEELTIMNGVVGWGLSIGGGGGGGMQPSNLSLTMQPQQQQQQQQQRPLFSIQDWPHSGMLQ